MADPFGAEGDAVFDAENLKKKKKKKKKAKAVDAAGSDFDGRALDSGPTPEGIIVGDAGDFQAGGLDDGFQGEDAFPPQAASLDAGWALDQDGSVGQRVDASPDLDAAAGFDSGDQRGFDRGVSGFDEGLGAPADRFSGDVGFSDRFDQADTFEPPALPEVPYSGRRFSTSLEEHGAYSGRRFSSSLDDMNNSEYGDMEYGSARNFHLHRSGHIRATDPRPRQEQWRPLSMLRRHWDPRAEGKQVRDTRPTLGIAMDRQSDVQWDRQSQTKSQLASAFPGRAPPSGDESRPGSVPVLQLARPDPLPFQQTSPDLLRGGSRRSSVPVEQPAQPDPLPSQQPPPDLLRGGGVLEPASRTPLLHSSVVPGYDTPFFEAELSKKATSIRALRTRIASLEFELSEASPILGAVPVEVADQDHIAPEVAQAETVMQGQAVEEAQTFQQKASDHEMNKEVEKLHEKEDEKSSERMPLHEKEDEKLSEKLSVHDKEDEKLSVHEITGWIEAEPREERQLQLTSAEPKEEERQLQLTSAEPKEEERQLLLTSSPPEDSGQTGEVQVQIHVEPDNAEGAEPNRVTTVATTGATGFRELPQNVARVLMLAISCCCLFMVMLAASLLLWLWMQRRRTST